MTLFLIILSGLLFGVSESSRPDSIHWYHEVLNFDCHGNDLGSVPNIDASQCADECSGNSACVGFVIDERPGAGSHVCYPKTACSTFQKLEQVHAYIFRTSNLDKYEVFDNTDCYSNDLPGVEGVTMEECDQICMAYDNCVSITYVPSNSKCHPKHACPEMTTHSSAITYRLKSYLSNLEKYDWKLEQDCNGNDIAGYLDTPPEVCDVLCMETEGCVGFVYNGRTNRCFLKNQCKVYNDVVRAAAYTLQKRVCELTPEDSCVDQFTYNAVSYGGCYLNADESSETPWCSDVTDSTKAAETTHDCSMDCRDMPHASQYGSVIHWESFDDTKQTDTATQYTMVYEVSMGKSGLITTINLLNGAIGREVGIGVYRKTGQGDCDFSLVKQILLHEHPDYRDFLQHKGAVKIDLNPDDYMPVAPDYHFGYYWNNQGSLYLTSDLFKYGFNLCGFASTLFAPYQQHSVDQASWTRHYSVNVVIESSGTDLNGILNGALFHDVDIAGVSHSKKTEPVEATDGDYTTCQTIPSNTIAVDFNRLVAVTQVKIHANSNYDVSVRTLPEDGEESNPCGSGSMTDNYVVITCDAGTNGWYLEVEITSASSGISICEIETKLGNLFETCIGDDCYFVMSQQANSPGLGQEECRRQFASATLFEPRNDAHWTEVGDWYKNLFLSGIEDWGERHDNHDCSVNSDIAGSVAETPEDCFQFCFRQRDCVAFSFLTEESGDNCFAKSDCADLAPNGEDTGRVSLYVRYDNSKYDAVVGMALWHHDDSLWHIQSTGVTTPTITKLHDHPDYFDYAVMNSETGKFTAEQSVQSHYILCMVSKSVYESSYKIVLRAAASTGSNFDSLRSDTTPRPSIDMPYPASLTSVSDADTDDYISPILQCTDWSAVQEVKLSLYKRGSEVASVLFGPGSSYDDWFTKDNLKGSSYHDLPASLTQDISVDGGVETDAKRLFFIQADSKGCTDQCSSEDCAVSYSAGWMLVLDTDHVSNCPWDYAQSGDFVGPSFLYSNENGHSSNFQRATVGTISVRLDQSGLGGSCVDTCNGLEDGNYQSCTGCNMFVVCTSETLKYETCRSGYKFDSEAGICSETSTTCTGSSAPKTCQSGCPSENPCQNEGTCVVQEGDVDGWLCECAPGFDGVYCDTDIDECATEVHECSEHSNCSNNHGNYSCVCEQGFEGTYCDVDIDECEIGIHECSEHSNCSNNQGSYSCVCAQGFEGIHCDTDIDECATGVHECSEHGTCLNNVGNYSCDCEQGFEGTYCDVDIDECEIGTHECLEHSNCSNNQGSYSCVCAQGFEGTHCEVDTDECAVGSHKCSEHGTCSNKHGNYSCICGQGFEGIYCDTDIDECATEVHECSEHSNCSNNQGSYSCDCEEGFEGDYCDENIDDCADGLCEHGTCVDGINKHTCDCEGTGFTGSSCEIQDYCFQNNQCGDNGECENDESNFNCACKQGFSGRLCEEEDICETQKINCNNGQCNLADGSPGWQCNCHETHIGERCDVLNTCFPDPCDSNENRICVMTDNQESYYCDCGTHIGVDCDITKPCMPDPCVNGDCSITGTPETGYGYQCHCKDHYSGKNCSIGPCDIEPCENGGTCEDALSTESGYTCKCVRPFLGDQCTVHPCDSSPCGENQECQASEDTNEGYTCLPKVQDNGSASMSAGGTVVLSMMIELFMIIRN